jgi:ADP-ribosylglycohydrolase
MTDDLQDQAMVDDAIKPEEAMSRLDIERDAKEIAVSNSTRDDLKQYSILSCLSVAEKQKIVEWARKDERLSRFMGSMCGMAVGDALGHPFEFMPCCDEPGRARFDLARMAFLDESNAFHLQRGQWTDDAAMGLCMADSLIMQHAKRQPGFSGSDMRIRFWCWWNRGYNNAFRKDPTRSSSVGLGGNIAKSLMAITRARDRVPDIYDADGEDAGNGSLMRFTPISLYLHEADVKNEADMAEVYKYSRLSSYTTHPGIIAAEACSLLGHLIIAALNRPSGPVDPKSFLEEETVAYMKMSGLDKKSGWGYDEMKWLVTGKPERPTERCWAWREESLDLAGTMRSRGSSYNGYPVSSGYFGSYSMDGLAMAMWSVYHTTSFDEAVVKSVNLRGDADSHGSITGQLAGALYGYDAINEQFITWLTQWDDHEFAVRAVLLHHLGQNREKDTAAEGGTQLPMPSLTRNMSRHPNGTPSIQPSLGRTISQPSPASNAPTVD